MAMLSKMVFYGGYSSLHDFHLIMSPNKYYADTAKQEGVGTKEL